MKTRLLLFLLLNLLPFSSATPTEEKVRLSWNFDNGSLGDWRRNDNGEIVLTHSPGSGGLWYYFQLDGVAGQTLTFVFESARGDYYGGLNLPSFSYDRSHWSYIKNRYVESQDNDPTRVRFSFTHTFARDRAWIAYTPPFSNTRLDEWLKSFASHPHVTVASLGETPIKNLTLPLLTVTDPQFPLPDKKIYLLFCREDAYETASSWIAEGAVRFLLSEDPVATEIKKRAAFLIVPLFDRDGVALGNALHPLPVTGESVFWTETWQETHVSFYEQRQMKQFLQQWKDQGRRIDGCLRIHSNGWQENLFRPESLSPQNQEAQVGFFQQTLHQQFFPWTQSQDPLRMETRFSTILAILFPEAMTGFYQCDFVYPRAFRTPYDLYKTAVDLQTEGELLVRAFASSMQILGNDPPPFLMAADLYDAVGTVNRQVHARCVYRDLLNRPPQFVRLLINDTAHDLMKVDEQNQDYLGGVLYSGIVTVDRRENTYSFSTSNGSRTASVPSDAPAPGPFLLSGQ